MRGASLGPRYSGRREQAHSSPDEHRVESAVWPQLPRSLKLETPCVRDWVLRRVGVSKGWGRGGHLFPRSTRPNRILPKAGGQRVVVRCFQSEHFGQGARRSHQLEMHLRYLMRDGAGCMEAPAAFFDRHGEEFEAREIWNSWRDDTRHYRLMISPEHGDCLADLQAYVQKVMGKVGDDLSEPRLTWIAACHFNTDHPHAHVVVRGRRENGDALLISPRYLYHGVSARAREEATAQLGAFSRGDEERQIWRETKAERFTGLDRRLTQYASNDGLVGPQQWQGPTWRALMRARLRTLGALGLAAPLGSQYRIAPSLQEHLTRVDLSQAKLRAINQHRLATGRSVQEFSKGRVKGEVLQGGFHDRRGTAGYVILRDKTGNHCYARLAIGEAPSPVGAQIELVMGVRGAERSAELDYGLG
jgi:hypothetical protein